MIAQKDEPSWGWWLAQGATTLWEQWNGTESRNHIMFDDVSAWFTKALAGIQPDPLVPGFKHFYVTPQVVGDLTSARGEYDSIRGRIVSEWTLEKGRFKLHVVVPPNTQATVSVPGASAAAVTEGRGPASQAKGVKSFRDEQGGAVFEIESGEYRFAAPRGP